MPPIDVKSCVFEGNDAPFLGVFQPTVNRPPRFGVLLFREFGNRLVKFRVGHNLMTLGYQQVHSR